MNASYEWLRAFVPFSLSPTELRDLLTSRCATVDDLVAFREDLRDVVIGRVVEAGRHPNSDHLWVTKVDAGGGTLVDVVCGAPNVSVNTLYPFAPVGAVLPGGVDRKRRFGERLSKGIVLVEELGLGQAQRHMALRSSPSLEPDSSTRCRRDTRLLSMFPNRPDLLSPSLGVRSPPRPSDCALPEIAEKSVRHRTNRERDVRQSV